MLVYYVLHLQVPVERKSKSARLIKLLSIQNVVIWGVGDCTITHIESTLEVTIIELLNVHAHLWDRFGFTFILFMHTGKACVCIWDYA